MHRSASYRSLLWMAALFAVGWRVLALRFPYQAATDPPLVQYGMAFMGLWFLACGLWAFRRAPSRASLLFAFYGATACLHWGGPLGFGSPAAQNLLLAFYIVASSALTQSLFLHVALAFERPWKQASRRGWLALIYSPVMVGSILFLVLLTRPLDRALLESFTILILTATLCSVAGAAVWIARLRNADPVERRERRLGLVVSAIVLGWLPYILASSGLNPWPGWDGLFNLPMALEPTAVALALSAAANKPESAAT